MIITEKNEELSWHKAPPACGGESRWSGRCTPESPHDFLVFVIYVYSNFRWFGLIHSMMLWRSNIRICQVKHAKGSILHLASINMFYSRCLKMFDPFLFTCIQGNVHGFFYKCNPGHFFFKEIYCSYFLLLLIVMNVELLIRNVWIHYW